MGIATNAAAGAAGTTPADAASLHKPRLLCLHGGGVNAEIFELQSRALAPALAATFRFVWANAPFHTDPHPDIVPVYGDLGPFRRWMRWKPHHPEGDADACLAEIAAALRAAMEADDAAGATGDWVGLMGFSQGAKLAASMLLEQQAREDRLGPGKGTGACGVEGVRWRFGILLAGRAPLTRMSRTLQPANKALVEVNEVSEGFEFSHLDVDDEVKIRLPTVHVHGLRDQGLHLHRKLSTDYCVEGSARLVEWDGDHRVPLKSVDVKKVVDAVLDMVEETGLKTQRSG